VRVVFPAVLVTGLVPVVKVEAVVFFFCGLSV